MRGRHFAELRAFVAIAEHGSFARAAARLRVSPSALSQTIRELEERLGVRLLNRTTRSVAPSAAGARLLARIAPAMGEIDDAVADVARLGAEAAGSLRLNVPRAALALFSPLVGRFHDAHPEVELELIAEDGLADIVKGRFDAGVRLGESLAKDMIALKLGGDFEVMVVGAPKYFERNGTPRTARDLLSHRCINWRMSTSGSLYRWELQRGATVLELSVEGPLIVNDVDFALEAAVQGVGIAYLFEPKVRPYLADGRLVRILASWSPSFAGFYLYYPSRLHVPPPLRAFVDFLRHEGVVPQASRSRSSRR